jgi:catechol 2,3-dioxygenase-like lactoylglutathione lyase family enzyme
MTIQGLGYLGIGTDKLEDWTNYATNWLGMQAVDRGAGVRAFRMDDRKQRLVVDRTLAEGQRYFGWEVASATALDDLAARLEGAGVAVKREPAGLAAQRFVSELVSFADPSGNRLEAFHGAQIADEPFRPGAFYLRLSDRTTRHGPCRADGKEYRRGAGVLSRPVGLPYQRLHPRADHRIFHAR